MCFLRFLFVVLHLSLKAIYPPLAGGQITAGRRGKTAARFGWDFFSGSEWYDNYRVTRAKGFDVGMKILAPNTQHSLICRHSACAGASPRYLCLSTHKRADVTINGFTQSRWCRCRALLHADRRRLRADLLS
jgi:hypothetical protein